MKTHYDRRNRHRTPRIQISLSSTPPPTQPSLTSALHLLSSVSAPPQPSSLVSPPNSSSPLLTPPPSSSPLPSPPPFSPHSPSPDTDLFIRNLHPSVPPSSLLSLFSPFGPLTSLRLITTKTPPYYSREIAYLSYRHPSSASTALHTLNGSFFHGRALLIRPSRRITDSRDWLFPAVDEGVRGGMQLDAVAEYSVTDEETAESFTALLLHLLPSTSTVTDACACVGGNTLSFARHFSHVQACELDHTRYTMLNHNLSIALPSASVSTFLGSYLDLFHLLRGHAVFIDPPFGGTDYELYDTVQPALGGVGMGELSRRVLTQSRQTKVIMMKLPRNVDWRGILRELAGTKGEGGEGVRERLSVAKVHYPKLILFLIEGSMERGDFIRLVGSAPIGGPREGLTRYVMRGTVEDWAGERKRGEEGGEGEERDGREVWEDVTDWTGVEEEVMEGLALVDPHRPFTPSAYLQVETQGRGRGKSRGKGRRGGHGRGKMKGKQRQVQDSAVVQNPFALLDDDKEEEAEEEDEEEEGMEQKQGRLQEKVVDRVDGVEGDEKLQSGSAASHAIV